MPAVCRTIERKLAVMKSRASTSPSVQSREDGTSQQDLDNTGEKLSQQHYASKFDQDTDEDTEEYDYSDYSSI